MRNSFLNLANLVNSVAKAFTKRQEKASNNLWELAERFPGLKKLDLEDPLNSFRFVKTVDKGRFHVFSKPGKAAKENRSIIYDSKYDEVQYGFFYNEDKDSKVYGASETFYANGEQISHYRAKKKDVIHRRLTPEGGSKFEATSPNMQAHGELLERNAPKVLRTKEDFFSSPINYREISPELIDQHLRTRRTNQTLGLYYLPNTLIGNDSSFTTDDAVGAFVRRINQLNQNENIQFESTQHSSDAQLDKNSHKTRIILTSNGSHQYMIVIRDHCMSIFDNGSLEKSDIEGLNNFYKESLNIKETSYQEFRYNGKMLIHRGDCVAHSLALMFDIFIKANGYSHDDLLEFATNSPQDAKYPEASEQPLALDNFQDFVDKIAKGSQNLDPQEVLTFEAVINELSQGGRLERKGNLYVLYNDNRKHYLHGAAFSNNYGNPLYYDNSKMSYLECAAQELKKRGTKDQPIDNKKPYVPPILRTRF